MVLGVFQLQVESHSFGQREQGESYVVAAVKQRKQWTVAVEELGIFVVKHEISEQQRSRNHVDERVEIAQRQLLRPSVCRPQLPL
jgi:hypothetical protein